MSWKRIALVVAVGLLLAACFFAGLVTGNRRAFDWMFDVQETEVTGSLSHGVSALTLLRAGDEEQAIRLMEARAGTAVVTLPFHREWGVLPVNVQQSLLMGKKYFEIHPPQSQSGEPLELLREALQWIPDEPLDPESCSPTVRLLLEGGHPDTGQPVE